MTKYTAEVTVERIGEREFEVSAAPTGLPAELPRDMADWLEREHGVRAADHGVDVVDVKEWAQRQGNGGGN